MAGSTEAAAIAPEGERGLTGVGKPGVGCSLGLAPFPTDFDTGCGRTVIESRREYAGLDSDWNH